MDGVSYYDELSSKVVNHATDFLHWLGIAPKSSDVLERVVILGMVFILAYLIYIVFNKFIIRIVHCVVLHTKRKWGTLLYENSFFHKLFGLIPPLIILTLSPLPFRNQSSIILEVIEKASYIYLIVMFVKLLFSFLNMMFAYFVKDDDDGYQSYKSACEIIKIFLVVLVILLIIGVVTGQKITTMVAGLGAFAAVLLLIFKDTLLGFIAGIQLAQNKMIKLGDWVQMDQYGANGTVFEMSLITIKIRNFDNTIVTVPPYSFLSSSFINWKGMSETGFRRIKKTILFDINTIKRIDDAFIQKVKDNPILSGYLNPEYMNSDPKRCKEQDKSTNMGLYRIWLEHYLMNHPHVRHDQYLIIQGNESDGGGFPLLVMFFIDTTVWETYEIIQSRIFEEIITVYSVFELAPYQFAGMFNSQASNNLKV